MHNKAKYLRYKMQNISHLYKCYNYYLKQYMRINTHSFVTIQTTSIVSIIGRNVINQVFTDVVSMSMFQRQNTQK